MISSYVLRALKRTLWVISYKYSGRTYMGTIAMYVITSDSTWRLQQKLCQLICWNISLVGIRLSYIFKKICKINKIPSCWSTDFSYPPPIFKCRHFQLSLKTAQRIKSYKIIPKFISTSWLMLFRIIERKIWMVYFSQMWLMSSHSITPMCTIHNAGAMRMPEIDLLSPPYNNLGYQPTTWRGPRLQWYSSLRYSY